MFRPVVALQLQDDLEGRECKTKESPLFHLSKWAKVSHEQRTIVFPLTGSAWLLGSIYEEVLILSKEPKK